MENHRHFWLLSYFVFYLLWFGYIESKNTTGFHEVHVFLDDLIPFCEWFIIPYILWFLYIAVAVCHTALFNKKEFYHLCAFLMIGMTVFLVTSTIYPNGHYLRPTTFEHTNIATRLCQFIYSADTATNLFPSIHVYNSIAVHSSIMHCREFEKNKPVRITSFILCISIILSTMLVKQHSVFDVVTAFALSYLVYHLVYVWDFSKVFGTEKHRYHLRHI